MFALLNSSKEKTILKVLLKKRKPNFWEKINLLIYYTISAYFELNEWIYTAFHIKPRVQQLIKISF